MNIHEALDKAKSYHNQGRTRRGIRVVFEYVFTIMDTQNFTQLSKDFEIIEKDNDIYWELLLAFLCICSTVREAIPLWENVRDKAYNEAKALGVPDVDDVFYGLWMRNHYDF